MEKFSSSLKIPFETKLGVLCGGMSSEREVSLRSGKNCFEALKRLGYKNTELIDVDKNISKTLTDKNIEVAYIALHGKYGEDGCIQGLLEILGIPYTGSDVKASAVAMDKEYTKIVLKYANIPVIPSIVITNHDDINNISLNLKFPLMVKPVCEGSSIGMTKVNSKSELKNAVKIASDYNSSIMLEEFIDGKSVTVGVLDTDSGTLATTILEFKTKTEWYDYEAKYTHGMTEFILPAQLPEDVTDRIQKLSIQAHKAIGAKGMSRVDFVVDKNNNPHALEINTIPGMTDLSDLPAQSKAIGIDYDTLVGIILNSALMTQEALSNRTKICGCNCC